MKIYIAGAITSNPNYIKQFAAAEKKLIAEGFAVINPVKNRGFTYPEYIDMGLNELMRCDAIYMLNGFEKSQGAKLELFYAVTTGKKIFAEGALVNIDIDSGKVKTLSIDELTEICTDNDRVCEYCNYFNVKSGCMSATIEETECKAAFKAYLTAKLCL